MARQKGQAVAKPICRVPRRATGSAHLAAERWSAPTLTDDERSETTYSRDCPGQFSGTGSVIGAEQSATSLFRLLQAGFGEHD